MWWRGVCVRVCRAWYRVLAVTSWRKAASRSRWLDWRSWWQSWTAWVIRVRSSGAPVKIDDDDGCCCRVSPLWAAIVGQPRNSIICRAWTSHQPALSTDRNWRCETSFVAVHSTRVRDGLLLSPSAGTAMTLHSAESFQERPLSSREVKTWWWWWCDDFAFTFTSHPLQAGFWEAVWKCCVPYSLGGWYIQKNNTDVHPEWCSEFVTAKRCLLSLWHGC